MPDRGIAFYRSISPLHPGSGESRGSIDNAIQREAHTDWPMSGVKGAFRSLWRQYVVETDKSVISLACADKIPDTVRLFGRDVNDEDEVGDGVLLFPDARIFAFPVRSAKGLFALVTCAHAINNMLEQALVVAGIPSPLNGTYGAINGENAEFTYAEQFVLNGSNQAFLEDVMLTSIDSTAETESLKNWLVQNNILSESNARRLAVVSDDVFTYFVRFCTFNAQRNKLDKQTKKVEPTALFVVEYLPPETVLYSPVVEKKAGHQGTGSSYDDWKDMLAHFNFLLNIGGDGTIGKGWCWVKCIDEPDAVRTE